MLLQVPLTKVVKYSKTGRKIEVEVRKIEVEVFAFKPFYERFVRLYQGDEYDEFEVDASHYNGDGLLLMALSRVRKLSGLKLTGISSMKQFKFKAKIDWKVEKL